MMRMFVVVILLVLGGCAGLQDFGRPPEFTPTHNSAQTYAMAQGPVDRRASNRRDISGSLWSRGSGSLFGDRRAAIPGDILTVVIEIDESAEISNASQRYRTGSQSASAPTLFGLETVLDEVLPGDASLSAGLSTNSTANSTGDGSVRRNEKLTLRVAATVVERLANGVVRIEGSQEVRVDFEIRELLVSGYVRPADISRKNEITYDKIASARVSYGGRGLISDLQQPPIGHQAIETVMPY